MPEMAQNLPEYDAIRRRLQSQFSQQKSEAANSLQRRYASQGMLGSGAYSKQAQTQDEEFGQKQAQAMTDVDFAQQGELQRRKEIEDQRGFVRGEREASQAFSTGQREASQAFSSGEAQKQRAFNEGLYNREEAFKNKLFESENRWHQLDFDESRRSNAVNALVALKNAELDPSALGDMGFAVTPEMAARFNQQPGKSTNDWVAQGAKAGVAGLYGGGWLW